MGRVDLHDTARPDPVRRLLARCRREGPGPRELAEAEQLRSAGHRVLEPLPEREPWRVARSGAGRMLRPARRALRPRLVVALSGVDGSGKSTLSAEVLEALERLGVPNERVWIRPGMLSPLVDRVVRLAKRASGASTTPGLHVAASGGASRLRSRRGLLGRVWVAVVVTDFALAVRRRLLLAEGVVVFDRHRRDAEVTLRLFYDLDATDPAVRLARRALPDPTVDVHLQVSPEVSLARKQEEIVGAWAVEQQVAMYGDQLLADPRSPRPQTGPWCSMPPGPPRRWSSRCSRCCSTPMPHRAPAAPEASPRDARGDRARPARGRARAAGEWSWWAAVLPSGAGSRVILAMMACAEDALGRPVVMVNLSPASGSRGGSTSWDNLRRTLGDVGRVPRTVRRGDVVHVHSALAPTVTALRAGSLLVAGRLRGAATVLHAHGGGAAPSPRQAAASDRAGPACRRRRGAGGRGGPRGPDPAGRAAGPDATGDQRCRRRPVRRRRAT